MFLRAVLYISYKDSPALYLVALEEIKKSKKIEGPLSINSSRLLRFFSNNDDSITRLSLVVKHRMTSILFHVLPPIHREILVVAATLSRAKQGDGKSFSLVRREAKMYIYIYTYIPSSRFYIFYIFSSL